MQTRSKYRLLIVDDNPVDRMAYRQYLTFSQEHVYSFIEADIGADGLKIFQQEEPDCLLLDFNLPDMTGLEFLQKLEELFPSDPQPVVILTGEGNESIAVETMKRGAQDYLIKGQVGYETLQRAITNTIEKVELHRQLKLQQEELRQFALAAAHDLRSPLSRISNYTQLLSRKAKGELSAENMSFLEEVLAGIQHMERVIQTLLDYSGLSPHHTTLSPVPLAQALEKATKQLEWLIHEYEVTVKCDLPPDIKVRGSEVQLIRLFQNLLENAIKYRSHEPPLIEISIQQDDELLNVFVKDNGVGIPQEQQELIFALFHRHNQTNQRGSGIGLATSQKIVQGLGGNLQVTSTPGRGTTFTIRLKRHKEDHNTPKKRGEHGTPNPT